MFLVNSRFSLVSAAGRRSGREVRHANWPPFSRSYGGILPSSLTTICSIALVFSTRPPESVWGTGGWHLASRLFLAAEDHQLRACALPVGSQPSCTTDLPVARPTALDDDYHRVAWLPSCVTPVNTLTHHPSRSPPPAGPRPEGRTGAPGRGLVSRDRVWAVLRRYGNINPSSIDYACRPRLRSRLTQGG